MNTKTLHIFSNYNFTPDWIKEYDDYFIYDRSDSKDYLKDFPQDKIRYVENIGSDIFDKLTWIIENYNKLPETVLLSKSNLFKYITREEFDLVKDNKTFTPLMTQYHKTYLPICYYQNGLYYELNNYFYLQSHSCKSQESMIELLQLLNNMTTYHGFAPGSNYILPRENILQHTKVFYMKLRSFLDWSIYPGESQIIERNLYNIFK